MIAAYISIEGADYDWFAGLCEFPVMPPIGGTIRVIDKNANMRNLIVKDVVIQGVRASIREELPNMYADLRIMLVCTEC